MLFHRSLALGIRKMCDLQTDLPVVLGGGVFQNKLLVELISEEFANAPQRLIVPSAIPINDGGLAAGQLAIAAARLKEERTCA